MSESLYDGSTELHGVPIGLWFSGYSEVSFTTEYPVHGMDDLGNELVPVVADNVREVAIRTDAVL